MSKRIHDTLKMTRTSAMGFELEWQDGYLFAEQITKEEAKRVVTAVNAHDDLLAACEAAQQWLMDNADFLAAYQAFISDIAPSKALQGGYLELFAQIQAALAKAKGGA